MNKLNEFLDGLLLGDGHLAKQTKNSNVLYAHTCKHKEYIVFIKDFLMQYNISFTPNIYVKPNGYGTGVGYQIYSHVDSFFTKEYPRWYCDKKKILPKDIIVTPLSLLHWYIGDGTLDTDQGYLRQIAISAHSFTYEERDHLVEKLNDIGISASNRKNGLICVKKKSVPYFLNYIGECPVSCYKYKWDISIYNSKQPKYTTIKKYFDGQSAEIDLSL